MNNSSTPDSTRRSKPGWTHPTHAKGVRSRDYSVNAHVSGPLTDRKIHVYALQGFYGTDVQAAAQKNEAKRKPKKIPSVKKQLRDLLKLLQAEYFVYLTVIIIKNIR